MPLLIAFTVLVLLCAGGEFLCRARWIDRLALVAALVLAIRTQPSLPHHRIAVAESITSFPGSSHIMMERSDRAAVAVRLVSRLTYTDLFMVSFSTLDGKVASVGLFGRVFVFGR